MIGLSLRPLALVLVASGITSCSSPPAVQVNTFTALNAPVQSPPGGVSLSERIGWWEDRLYMLEDADRAEAYLRLGQLYLSQQSSVDARRCFRLGRKEHISERELAEAEYGIGLSYLLEDRPDRASGFLALARENLSGPTRQECEFLLSVINGLSPDAPDDLLARLAPYLGDDDMASIRLASSKFGSAGLFRAVDVSRVSWNAQPLRSNHSDMGTPNRITIHHSAEPLTSTRLVATRTEVRRLQGIHQDHKNWADIGYHYLIDRAGRIVEGRDLRIQGAHAGDNILNAGNIGICILGNFSNQPDRGPDYARAQEPTTAQLQSLEDLVDSLRDVFGITKGQVFSHGELKVTECPGPSLRVWLQQYR